MCTQRCSDQPAHLHNLRSLRRHAYSNILKILPPKTENFQIKNSDIFHITDQNIDCGYPLEPPRRGDSNEYPQSLFINRNKKNNVYPYEPQLFYIKVGFKGSKLYRHIFVMRTAVARLKNIGCLGTHRTRIIPTSLCIGFSPAHMGTNRLAASLIIKKSDHFRLL